MLELSSLYSGSSGNCIYAQSGDNAIIIDAGVSFRSLQSGIKKIGGALENVKGVFVTHEHRDHMSGIYTLVNKLKIPIYTNENTALAMQSLLPELCSENFCILPTGKSITIGNIEISSFKTPHDAVESVGYLIESNNRRAGIATDLGHITTTVYDSLKSCQLVLLESNHDYSLLDSCAYPYFLKKRILSDNGHLSNVDCAKTITSLAASGTKQFILGHISKDSNTYFLAQEETANALLALGDHRKKIKVFTSHYINPVELIMV